jgi:hypothetical protein
MPEESRYKVDPSEEDSKRRLFKTTIGNLYILTGENFQHVTVPRENSEEKRTLRQTIDKITENAPHRDWLGIEQFILDAEQLYNNPPKHIRAELDEVVRCLAQAAGEYHYDQRTKRSIEQAH